MSRCLKIAVIGAVVLAILVLGASLVLAQEPQDSQPSDEGASPDWGGWSMHMGGHGRGGMRGGTGPYSGDWMETLSEELNLSSDEILEQLRDGATIAELAESQGIDIQDLIDAWVDQARELITGWVNEPWDRPHGLGGGELLDLLAEEMGLSVDDVKAELATGISIADLAAEQGVDVQQIIDAWTAQHVEALNQAVADGRITRERADAMLEQMAERIEEMVSEPWTSGWHGHGPGMRGGCGDSWNGFPGRMRLPALQGQGV